MLKKNKLFVILLVILIVILSSLNNCVNAVSFSGNSVEKLLTEEYPYYFIFQNPQTSDYYMVISSVTTTCWGSGDLVLNDYSSQNTKFYKCTGVNWALTDINSIDNVVWRVNYTNRSGQLNVQFNSGYGVNSLDCFKYCNFDILTTNSSDVFFQNTPLVPLGEIVEEAPTGEVMSQIIQILPMILVVVVSLVGLRKALQILSQILHKD